MKKQTPTFALYTPITILSLFSVIPFFGAGSSRPQAAIENSWTAPQLIWGGADYPCVSADGTRIAALEPRSGADDFHRDVKVVEFTGTAWKTPVLIASNGLHPSDATRTLPLKTHPVISGDGNVVVYLGATDQFFPDEASAIYVSDRTQGSWGKPYILCRGLENYDNRPSVSEDGNVIAFCNYPLIGTQHVYVCARSGGVWSAPAQITDASTGGSLPALSAGGRKLAFVAGRQLWYSENGSAGWSKPVRLTTNDWREENVEYPRFSADGMSLFYWSVRLTAQGGVYNRTSRDLFAMSRGASAWGAPARVTQTSIKPTPEIASLPAINASGTLAIYSRTANEGDAVSGSYLESAEIMHGSWFKYIPVTVYGGAGSLDRNADLSRDGKLLVYSNSKGLILKKMTGSHPSDFVGTWAATGVWYRNSDTAEWVNLTVPAAKIATGDLDGDGIDDLIGIWPASDAVWVRYSKTGRWAIITAGADWIATGDMNGDGRVDLLGSWSDSGVYYRDAVSGDWVRLASAATQVAAGDLDADGIDDLIGNWTSDGGVWVRYSKTGKWKLIGSADWIATGDVNGDGRAEFIGNWQNSGVYYLDADSGAWVMLAQAAMQIAAGDLDGDGIDDLVGTWPSGAWVRYSKSGQWEFISAAPDWLAVGKLRRPTN